MELRQLKYFLAVADARSFVAAADTLFISRQAISKSVAQLEQERPHSVGELNISDPDNVTYDDSE